MRTNKIFSSSGKLRGLLLIGCLTCGGLGSVGCRSEGPSRDTATFGSPRFIPLGTAQVGGAFQPVGNAIAAVLNENRGEASWTVQASATKGTLQNIRMLDKQELMLGMSNAAISYYAVQGTGIWDRPYEIRAIATLAPNVGLFITKRESGIRRMADLKGKRVAVGPAGAGFETFLSPILTAHGITYTDDQQDFTPVPADYSTAVQLLGDGNIDAAFMGGAIPVAAITQATSTMDIFFIPFDEEVRQRLIDDFSYFQDALIPAVNAEGQPTYKGLAADFPALDVGSMQLITHAEIPEALVYDLTRKIWEHRAAIAAQHRAGQSIREDNVARFVGTEFHPGAVRFYREIGIWQDTQDEDGQ